MRQSDLSLCFSSCACNIVTPRQGQTKRKRSVFEYSLTSSVGIRNSAKRSSTVDYEPGLRNTIHENSSIYSPLKVFLKVFLVDFHSNEGLAFWFLYVTHKLRSFPPSHAVSLSPKLSHRYRLCWTVRENCTACSAEQRRHKKCENPRPGKLPGKERYTEENNSERGSQSEREQGQISVSHLVPGNFPTRFPCHTSPIPFVQAEPDRKQIMKIT